MASLLIIEDDAFLRSLLVKRLAEAGFEIGEAADGAEGLKLIQEKVFDLIVLDLIMPGVDGYEVLKRLKENKETANMPVLILSNLGDPEAIEKATKLGADDYMIKAHFTLEEVEKKIRKILKK